MRRKPWESIMPYSYRKGAGHGNHDKANGLIRWIKFGIVGVVNTAIDFLLFAFFVHILDMHILPANIISYSAGITNSFILNKTWTFKDRTRFSKSISPFVRFIIINISSLVLSTFVVWVLSHYFPAVVSKAFSIVVTFIWNYSFTRLLVFAPEN